MKTRLAIATPPRMGGLKQRLWRLFERRPSGSAAADGDAYELAGARLLGLQQQIVGDFLDLLGKASMHHPVGELAGGDGFVQQRD